MKLVTFLVFLVAFFAQNADCRHVTTTALQLQRSTAASTEIVLQATVATFNDASIATNHDGYTGNGFIDYGDTNAFAAWNVDVPVSGFYEITVRFASTNNRGPMSLLIGGNKVGEFPIIASGAWTTWKTETITANISAGNDQEIKLVADRIRGPNVDMITLKAQDFNSDPDPGTDPNYKVVLAPNGFLVRNQYVRNNAGNYEVGLDNSGDLVVRQTSSSVVWSLEASENKNLEGEKLFMQNDGNLVLREQSSAGNTVGSAIWSSRTYSNPNAYFVIDDQGGVAVIDLLGNQQVFWRDGLQNQNGPNPTPVPVSSPTRDPTPAPTPAPVPSPTSGGPAPLPRNMPSGIVLASNQNFQRGIFVSSPNGLYSVGLNSVGNLVMVRDGREIWRLRDKSRRDITGVGRAFMQSDGNLVLRALSGRGLWNSETSNNPGGVFTIDDGGQLSIVYAGTVLWMDGIPRGVYSGPSSPNLQYPIRGIFYYAWFPETWEIGGVSVFYTPNLGAIPDGFYKSGDPLVVKEHVKALDYGLMDLGIISWWGESDRLDRARITQLLDETARQNSPVKWTVYYEDEKANDYSVGAIIQDLDYLKKWFAWHKTWAHKDGKPVIFVWNESQCEVSDRWVEAARRAGWYVVLKLFGGYTACPSQPDSWHQYGVSDNFLDNPPDSFAIAPGFWKADEPAPRNPRIGQRRFCEQVNIMNQSNRNWHLITSFNEWGEGTSVESAREWSSASGYGQYLDCLHDPIRFG